MSQEFLKYKAQATSLKLQGDPEIEWQRIFDWYNAEGRQLFIDAFAKETGIRLTNTPGQDDLVAAGSTVPDGEPLAGVPDADTERVA